MTGPAFRIVVVDDDPFTVSLVAGALESFDFRALAATTPEDAWQLVELEEPHAVIADLDLGPGESGVSLLRRVRNEYPWIGLVALTTHLSPELAADSAEAFPDGAVYVVKSSVKRPEDLVKAVNRAITGSGGVEPLDERDDLPVITKAQAEVLRMLAKGASTRAIAEQRGTSVRAAETMLVRLYGSLEISVSTESNPRVEAVHRWQRGRVRVR